MYLIIVVSMFNLHFSDAFLCWFPSVCSLMRHLLKSWAHFLKWLSDFLLLCFKCSLYILDESLSSDMSLSNIFSQSVCFPNLLTTVSQIICFYSYWSPVYQSFFLSWTLFFIVSKKSSPNLSSLRFPLILSSRNFIVLFTFRSVIHLE